MSAEGTNEIYIFFTSRDEIKVIFTTNIRIFFLLYTSLSIEEMQILQNLSCFPLRKKVVPDLIFFTAQRSENISFIFSLVKI